jgi:hypothetical protein
MGTLKWYKRDPRAALIGMHGLTLEERGAYNTILDLLYCRDGILVDDPREIAKWMSVDPRTWKAIRLRLINKGKLYVNNGCLHNERAANEIPDALERVLIRRRSAIDRWAVFRNIKGLQTKYAMTTTKKKESLDGNVVPIAKRPSEVGRKELEQQFARKRGEPPDSSRETPPGGE